jgi:type VI secretion system protein ImpF
MAEINSKKRLSPPLMYVFRAAHAAHDSKSKAYESASSDKRAGDGRSRLSQRVAINERTLRGEVARDLETLMNCVAMSSSVDLDMYPAVQRSILNYGFPDIAHRSIDELAASDLDQEIERILRLFEPRLIEASMRVTRDRSVDIDDLKIRYIVHADLACEPINIPLQFVADLEVTTGKIQIHRL